VLILAIDTATSHVGAAIGRDGAVLAEVGIAGARRHAEALVPAIDGLRAETGISLDDLTGIAVGVGPGLYTGLRVGVTTARTLAQVLDVPVVGIPSLDLVAYPRRSEHRRVVALVDARRKEVFAAHYRTVPGGIERDGEYTVETPAAVAAALASAGAPCLVVGDGAVEYAEAFAGIDHVEVGGPAVAAPSVAALVELATARFERGETSRAEEITPLYLRRSDAEIAWDRR
jgi:tRNA threonylcarbamoyladenosine biosynthesis protein TsaB